MTNKSALFFLLIVSLVGCGSPTQIANDLDTCTRNITGDNDSNNKEIIKECMKSKTHTYKEESNYGVRDNRSYE